MFWKFLRESLWRPGSRHHAVWAVLAVAMGTAIAAAMLSVSLDIGDKIGRELRSLGANIVITPAADSLPVEIGGIDYRTVSEGTYIPDSSLPKLKEIFWRNNIVAFAPFVYVPARVLPQRGSAASARESGRGTAESTTLVGTWYDRPFTTSNGERFQTGVRVLNPSWQITGSWIDDSAAADAENYCLAGKSLAASLHLASGDAVSLAAGKSESQPRAGGETPKQIQCTIRGILTTGGAEDQQIFTTLAVAQSLAGMPGKTRKIQASALIKPEDEKSRRDPKTMTSAEYERWYCSPYISSILHQIDEVLPGASARQISPVAETEGKVLGKLEFLMATLAVLALVAAALSISSIATIRVVKRRQEISLMKAIGAEDRLVSTLFLAEAALQGIVGGVLGFGGGLLLARLIERLVFGGELVINWLLLPVVVLTGLLVSFAGTWGALKVAQNYEPAAVLRGE